MNNIKLLRTQRGLSQQKLADILNVSQQSVHKYENELSEPDIFTLKTMANYFGTSIDYVVGNTQNPHSPDMIFETNLSQDELEHMRLYRRVSTYRRHLINMLLEDYTQNPTK